MLLLISERGREKHQWESASSCTPELVTQACDLPRTELVTCGAWAKAQPTEPHRLGLCFLVALTTMCNLRIITQMCI